MKRFKLLILLVYALLLSGCMESVPPASIPDESIKCSTDLPTEAPSAFVEEPVVEIATTTSVEIYYLDLMDYMDFFNDLDVSVLNGCDLSVASINDDGSAAYRHVRNGEVSEEQSYTYIEILEDGTVDKWYAGFAGYIELAGNNEYLSDFTTKFVCTPAEVMHFLNSRSLGTEDMPATCRILYAEDKSFPMTIWIKRGESDYFVTVSDLDGVCGAKQTLAAYQTESYRSHFVPQPLTVSVNGTPIVLDGAVMVGKEYRLPITGLAEALSVPTIMTDHQTVLRTERADVVLNYSEQTMVIYHDETPIHTVLGQRGSVTYCDIWSDDRYLGTNYAPALIEDVFGYSVSFDAERAALELAKCGDVQEPVQAQFNALDMFLLDWKDCATLFETGNFSEPSHQHRAKLSVTKDGECVIDWRDAIDDAALDEISAFEALIEYEAAQFACDPYQVTAYLNGRGIGDGTLCQCMLLVSADASFPLLIVAQQNGDVHLLAINDHCYPEWTYGLPYLSYYDLETFQNTRAPRSIQVVVNGIPISTEAYRMYEAYRLPVIATLEALSAVIHREKGLIAAELGNGVIKVLTEDRSLELLRDGEQIEHDMLIQPGDTFRTLYTSDEYYATEPYITLIFEEIFGYTVEYDAEQGVVYLTN